jgi:sarcosine oxidase subunit gamma
MDELAEAPVIPIVETAAVQISPVSGQTLFALRSWLPRRAQSAPVVVGGQELPSQVGAIVSDTPRVMCLGPQEWLIVSSDCDASGLRARIEPDLAKQGLVLVDLTDGFATLEVQGPAARELLSKGCGLDFHPRSFPAGYCARTRFAQFPLTIACLSEPLRFELIAGRSYARYLQAWLTDAAVTLTGV